MVDCFLAWELYVLLLIFPFYIFQVVYNEYWKSCLKEGLLLGLLIWELVLLVCWPKNCIWSSSSTLPASAFPASTLSSIWSQLHQEGIVSIFPWLLCFRISEVSTNNKSPTALLMYTELKLHIFIFTMWYFDGCINCDVSSNSYQFLWWEHLGSISKLFVVLQWSI